MIRKFTQGDIAPALQLCRSAGWNQLDGDWQRLIHYQPDGCFVAELNHQIVGTLTTTSYGTRLAWIGMMLVHPDYRRRGIATKLMNAGLQYLRDGGVRCIKLDATPAGQPVYEKLGFQSEWSFHRWQLESPSSGMEESAEIDLDPSNFRPAPFTDRHAACDLDAFGVDRTDWLLRQRAGSITVQRTNGFGMLRGGFLANYLGPVTAADPNSAREIIVELLSHATSRVFWDVPKPNGNASDLAAELGFMPVRDLTRMWLGELMSPEVRLQYAMCDPGTG